MEEAILEVQELNIEFHDHELPETVVSDLSFTLHKGEILGIVGESGSGKSMTALAIAGLLSRKDMEKRGTILFEGQNLLKCGRNTLRSFQGDEISVIFQEPMTSLNPVRKIGWQVEESLRIHHPDLSKEQRRTRAQEILESCELKPEVYDMYPHELSGGMRQRVMIASAMICDPKILIADEPTTALDVTIQEQIIHLLLKLNKKKHTSILFISHDLSLVRRLCENVIVMQHGKMVEQGPAEEIFAHPKEEYTKILTASIPKVVLTEEAKKHISRPRSEKNAQDKRPPLVKTVDLYSWYRQYGKGKARKVSVLKDVSFEIRPGQVFGLVGESGSGKSTLAKALTGIVKDTEGEILRPENGFAMIFQDPAGSLNPAKKVGWLLTEPLRIRGKKDPEEMRQKAIRMLEKVGLSEEYMDRYPMELSGGQRQRVCIGIALMQEASVLIADEPVSALDVTVQAQILKLLRDLKQEMNLSILFISHDLRVVYNMCDYVMIMKKGEIVEQAARDRIYFSPEQQYTKDLLAAAGLGDLFETKTLE